MELLQTWPVVSMRRSVQLGRSALEFRPVLEATAANQIPAPKLQWLRFRPARGPTPSSPMASLWLSAVFLVSHSLLLAPASQPNGLKALSLAEHEFQGCELDWGLDAEILGTPKGHRSLHPIRRKIQ